MPTWKTPEPILPAIPRTIFPSSPPLRFPRPTPLQKIRARPSRHVLDTIRHKHSHRQRDSQTIPPQMHPPKKDPPKPNPHPPPSRPPSCRRAPSPLTGGDAQQHKGGEDCAEHDQGGVGDCSPGFGVGDGRVGDEEGTRVGVDEVEAGGDGDEGDEEEPV